MLIYRHPQQATFSLPLIKMEEGRRGSPPRPPISLRSAAKALRQYTGTLGEIFAKFPFYNSICGNLGKISLRTLARKRVCLSQSVSCQSASPWRCSRVTAAPCLPPWWNRKRPLSSFHPVALGAPLIALDRLKGRKGRRDGRRAEAGR